MRASSLLGGSRSRTVDGFIQELFRAGVLSPARVRPREETQRLAESQRVAQHPVSGDRRDVELLALGVVAACFGHLSRARRGPRPLRVIGRHELERPSEIAGRSVRVQRGGAFAREQERRSPPRLARRREIDIPDARARSSASV